MPFHNLWIPRTKPDPNEREYWGISGCHLVDNTSKRLVIFYDVNFLTLPVICGCYLRHSTSFPDTFVPLAITERMTRIHPIVFKDNPDGTNTLVINVMSVDAFKIDPTAREHFKGMDWVSMTKL